MIPLPTNSVRGQPLGLFFDQRDLTTFPCPIGSKDALDSKQESWSPLWLFPKLRDIAQNATLTNSVTVRSQNDSNYRTGNLSLLNGSPGPTYATEAVVA